MLAEAADGLLLATVQAYSPATVTFRVWVYCAVTGSFNTVLVPSMTVVKSLVQVTVVAGPPVEIQVRVLVVGSYVTPPEIVISPKPLVNEIQLQHKLWYPYAKAQKYDLLIFSTTSTLQVFCVSQPKLHSI